MNSMPHIGHVLGIEDSGGADAHRQNSVCPDHGLSPMEHLSLYRAEIQRRLSSALSSLCRAVRIMAFAQRTYRESLRDIEACLSAQAAKLYHMGLQGPISRSTLADANEARDWRICSDFVQRLIVQARKLYSGEFRCGHLQYRLCAGRHDYRSLSVDVSLGSLSDCQGRRKSS